MKVKRRMPVVIVSVIALLSLSMLAVEYAFERYYLGWKSDNRITLYQIQQRLRPGMSLDEVNDTMAVGSFSVFRSYISDDKQYVTHSIGVGWQTVYDLRLEFADDKLVHSFVRDADNGEKPKDSPPDF